MPQSDQPRGRQQEGVAENHRIERWWKDRCFLESELRTDLEGGIVAHGVIRATAST